MPRLDDILADGRPDRLPRWFRAGRTASLAVMARFHAMAPPQTLYRYTSTAALISIVRNNELWLSDATFLNDRAGQALRAQPISASISFTSTIFATSAWRSTARPGAEMEMTRA